MHRIFMNFMLIVALLSSSHEALAAADCGAKLSNNAGMLYRIDEPGRASSYILGGLHSGYQPISKLPPRVKSAILGAKEFYLEANVENKKETLENFNEFWYIPDNKTISDYVSNDAIEKLANFLIPMKLSERQKAAVYKMTPLKIVAEIFGDVSGLDNSPSLDELILKVVRDQNIRVGYIETSSYTMAGLRAVTADEWSNFLIENLATASCVECKTERQHVALCTAELIRLGDAESLSRMNVKYAKKHPAYGLVIEKLIFSRNEHMSKVIRSILETGGGNFILVGGNHLGGHDGILQRLRDYGINLILSD